MRRLGLPLVLLAASASAAERTDHDGALGLLVAGSADERVAVGTTAAPGTGDLGFRAGVELGGTWALSAQKELKLSVRLFPAGANTSGAVMGGLRNGFQVDRWRTFFDLELAAYVGSVWTIGPHLGLGVQYELLPVMGVYAAVGTHFGLGSGARFLGEFVLGFQFRSYLLE
jgi:hypothetical protein